MAYLGLICVSIKVFIESNVCVILKKNFKVEENYELRKKSFG